MNLKIEDLRPKSLTEVIGNDTIKDFLSKCLEQYWAPNAMLLTGSFGCGKTLIARLFSKSFNCINYFDKNKPCDNCLGCSGLDIKEFNSSNYSQVDDIRNLIDDLHTKPMFSKKKFYILDECHMMSPKSFSALLKEIEEPGLFSSFILITSEVHMLPEPLISRCFLLKVLQLPEEDIFVGLKKALTQINSVDISEEILRKISTNSNSMRDAIISLFGYLKSGELILPFALKSSNLEITAKDLLKLSLKKDFKNLLSKFEEEREKFGSKKIFAEMIKLINFYFKNKNLSEETSRRLIEILAEGFKRTSYIEIAYLPTLISLCRN